MAVFWPGRAWAGGTWQGVGSNLKFKYDAFISYAPDDREKAGGLAKSLAAQGLKCWIAHRVGSSSSKSRHLDLKGRCQSRHLSIACFRAFSGVP